MAPRAPLKWSRLFQPRHPLFWLLVALNGLSAVLSWMVQNKPLNTVGFGLLTVFLLSNALASLWLGARLLREAPPGETER